MLRRNNVYTLYITIKMDKINHYVAKMTFLGLAMFPWKRLKKAKNTVKQRILQAKTLQNSRKIYEKCNETSILTKNDHDL